ncbi:MAG: GntR family transcriptional regulator [Phototrophicaceae bacterium]
MPPTIPKYAQLMQLIQEKIQQGVWGINQQLPNEDELVRMFQMSRGTVRKGMSELQHQGIIRKEQGRGTFVNAPKPFLNGFSVVEFGQYQHLQQRVPKTRTLILEQILATQVIAKRLDLPLHHPVWHLIQLQLADDVPQVYEERYFDVSLCPTLTAQELEQSSIHTLLVERYHIPLVRLAHTIEVMTLPADKWAVFEVSQSINAFQVERLSYTQKQGRIFPAVSYYALYRADDFQFVAQFKTSI